MFRHPLLENPPAGTTGLPLQTRRHQALVLAARQLCTSCPVRQECLRDSVLHSDPGGFAAATTEQERRLIRQRLGVGDEQGYLVVPVHARHQTVGLRTVLDAYASVHERGLRPGRPGTGLHPVPPHETHEASEESMAAPAGADDKRISFPLDDPARAIQKAVLTPLVRAVLPLLEATEQLAGMLVHAHAAGLTPALIDACREARRCIEAWRTESGDDAPYRAADSGLTGTVSVELATSDPLTALRQDILEPLLRRLAESISRVEAITSMLLTTKEPAVPHRTELAAVHTALRDLAGHIEVYGSTADSARPTRAVPGHRLPVAGGSASMVGALGTLPAATSLRRAVEGAVARFPGPFTARDVLLALPPDMFRESGKSVSNVLSAMVKSGRLQRVSRGTYTVVTQSTSALATHS
ncbi:WhiB family transcriptional regulator [Streptomyces sp. MUM 203J]|uniref:WhiB family transcriptional regulator n=1 Tax=Streptomyces sp. MUM 203J TaxID=2791990 RepID=UPI001F03D5E5|nr:WhiB family transcriptional regulator [Streptomyces sp. MUM 203J]MCH0540234.1 WhiB family transcriptional regulator [Streptomyces sp. MUM 203J]